MYTLLEVFGRLHPALLHLPMGMLFGLGIYEIHAWRKGQSVAPKIWVYWAAGLAVFAAASGWMLHEEPGYTENFSLEWHERLGIATAIGALLCARFYKNPVRYRRTLLLTVGLMLGAGHFGGTMTHGKDFMFEPLLRLSAEKRTAADAEKVSYTYDIAPILKSKCAKCHSSRKQKGELRLDTPEWILKGGEKEGAAVNAGRPDGHPILQRMLLDLEDEDHMPPEDKRQLTDDEAELIKKWLLLGAPFDAPKQVPS